MRNHDSPSPAPPPPPEQSARELDALVSVKLFGWEEGILDMAREGKLKLVTDDPECGTYLIGPPAYSTDPAAMMEVVEAMRARGLEFTLSSPTPTEARWDATFWDFNPPREYCELAESPARAVCLAALASVPPEGGSK